MSATATRKLRLAVRLIFALVALTGQSAVVGIGAAGEVAGAAAHVEGKGIAVHHGHDEATCLACRALSLHGKAPVHPGAQPPVARETSFRPRHLARRLEQATLPSSLSRAPPGIA